MPVELLPEGHLLVRKAAARHLDLWWTCTFPVAYQLNHADIEHHAVNALGLHVQERAGLEKGLGMKLHITHAEIKPHLQALLH